MKHFLKLFLFAIWLTVFETSRAHAGETGAPRIALQAGEIMLQGRIEGVSFASREVTISFDRIVSPSGFVTMLALPRPKTVTWNAASSFVAPPSEILVPPVAIEPAPDETSDVENTSVAPTVAPPTIAPVQQLTVDALWPRKAIAVVGVNTEKGNVFAARVLEIGIVRGALYQPAAGTVGKDSKYYNGVKDWVAASGLRVAARFPVRSIGGKAARGNKASDHPRGLALDFMVGRDAKLGDLIATYFQQFAGQENVNYIIWKDRLVYADPRTDWSKVPTDYTGDVTQRHMDHVHVSFLPAPEMPGPYLSSQLTRKKTTSRPTKKKHARRRR